jgi:hypothetical protein
VCQILQLLQHFVGQQLHKGSAARSLAGTHRIKTMAVEGAQDVSNTPREPVEDISDLVDLPPSGGIPQNLAVPSPDRVLGAQPAFDFHTF